MAIIFKLTVFYTNTFYILLLCATAGLSSRVFATHGRTSRPCHKQTQNRSGWAII